jgi:2-oxoglutarate dehydrogenase E2 component (dihydrolipoamide succinyltransferase)
VAVNVKVFAPLIGEGVEELTLVSWKKKVGDSVKEGEELVELESDKVTTEVPSPATGRIAALLAEAGTLVRAGQAIALLEEGAIGPAASDEAAAAAKPEPAPTAGPEGASAALRPHSLLRRRIAERMIESQRTSAQVFTVAEADLSAVVAHRAAHKEAFAGEGVRLTLSAYFVSALARALRLFPEMNSSWSEEGMILHPEINIGVAVSLGGGLSGGLIVPVIRRADALSLMETAHEIERLANAARSGTLGSLDVKGGTFTLTNYGATLSLFAAPIIDQPQIGILGTGSLQRRPVAVMGSDGVESIAIRPMVYLSLVFDHRAIDGEAAGLFLRGVKEGLEAWPPSRT